MDGTRILRTQLVEGVTTPAIIHNSSYFFVNLQVYADGLVNCWEMVDLAMFRAKLASGWVTPSIPDGKSISVHGLASWRISDARWDLTPDALHDRVTSLVRTLNPNMHNLYDCYGSTVDVIGKVRYSKFGIPRERPVRYGDPLLGRYSKRVEGEQASILVRFDDVLYLADLRVFADGTIELGHLPVPETIDAAGLAEYAASGRVRSSVPAGTRIAIHELGAFTVAAEDYATELDDVLRTVPDLVDKANGRPDSVQRCRDAHRAYVDDATDARREALRAAYEAVPSHNRMYVGGMDSKDSEVRHILYGESPDEDDELL